MKFVGIDWATEVHFAALVDEHGGVLSEWKFLHSHDGLIEADQSLGIVRDEAHVEGRLRHA